MKGMNIWGLIAIALGLGIAIAGETRGYADTVSYTGTLASAEDSFSATVSVADGGSVTLQTYGFGGGVNAAGATITAGGFDPFVGLFSGTGNTAAFIDGTSDVLTNYSPGCPPAGTATVGSIAGQCGDVAMTFNGLAAGTYTVLLTDAAYLPNAVFETGGTIGDGFMDLTGGAFQTCIDENNCNTDTADWALDVTTSGGTTSPVPEPPSVELAGLGLLFVAGWILCSKKQVADGFTEGGHDASV